MEQANTTSASTQTSSYQRQAGPVRPMRRWMTLTAVPKPSRMPGPDILRGHWCLSSAFGSLSFATMFRTTLARTALAAARPTLPRVSLAPKLARGYHEKVISHYERPRNVSFGSGTCLERLSDNFPPGWLFAER